MVGASMRRCPACVGRSQVLLAFSWTPPVVDASRFVERSIRRIGAGLRAVAENHTVARRSAGRRRAEVRGYRVGARSDRSAERRPPAPLRIPGSGRGSAAGRLLTACLALGVAPLCAHSPIRPSRRAHGSGRGRAALLPRLDCRGAQNPQLLCGYLPTSRPCQRSPRCGWVVTTPGTYRSTRERGLPKTTSRSGSAAADRRRPGARRAHGSRTWRITRRPALAFVPHGGRY